MSLEFHNNVAEPPSSIFALGISMHIPEFESGSAENQESQEFLESEVLALRLGTSQVHSRHPHHDGTSSLGYNLCQVLGQD